jgi:hypothetical protein
MGGLYLQAASKALQQPGHKTNYDQDMPRYIPFKSVSEEKKKKLFNRKGRRAERSVGSDYGRRGIETKETATV